MKKLKIKVFLTIFSILTLFTLLLVGTSSARDYMEKRNSIAGILQNVSRPMNDKKGPEFMPNDVNQNIRKIYLDFTIYTIVLDDDGNYLKMINNTNDDDVDEDKVKAIANKIIKNHSSDLYVGNLYVTKYSYSFSNNNLIIVDNSNLNKMLVNKLATNVLLFVLAEVVIFIITYFLTRWITMPVKKSFEKQKQFVADASHELKTPLAVMIASADAYFNDKDEKWIHNMKNESERMIKLVTQLLDLAKTEEVQDIAMKEENLSNIVESSILTFESLFYENNIKLKYDITPDIKFTCNEDLMVELMGILIDNSIKHCSEKGKVFVNLYKENKQIVLTVKNSGLPINKEDEEKIFERFYKVDSSRNRNSNNYGLGLAIAKNIVLKHNGTISAHSSNGYTTFKAVWNQK